MELRITNSALIRTALADVQRQRARLFRAQEQAASGLRVNRPSDDPSAASAALLLRSGLDATEQYDRNLTQARSRIAAVDSALSATADVLIRARELAMTGANDTNDATSRALVAEEVEALHARLLSEANARSAGGYVFGGFAASTAPFQVAGPFVDGSPAPAVSFVGDSNEIEVTIDEGVTVRATRDGRDVFLGDADGDGSVDPGRENLFALLGDLRDALQADDRAAIAATLTRVDTAQTQISVARTDVGATQTRLDAWQDRLAERSVDLASRLSLVQDADATEVFTALVNEETALRAALSSAERLIQPTLLDFLR